MTISDVFNKDPFCAHRNRFNNDVETVYRVVDAEEREVYRCRYLVTAVLLLRRLIGQGKAQLARRRHLVAYRRGDGRIFWRGLYADCEDSPVGWRPAFEADRPRR